MAAERFRGIPETLPLIQKLPMMPPSSNLSPTYVRLLLLLLNLMVDGSSLFTLEIYRFENGMGRGGERNRTELSTIENFTKTFHYPCHSRDKCSV
jgi:hypothetical protein